MSITDDLDEVLYKELLGYESAVANAALRFEDQTSEDVRRKLYRADGRLRYWVFVYIVAIDLFSPNPRDFGRNSSCQAEILRHCRECEQPELLELFPKARDSAWRAIVLMAERELTGEPNPESLPIERKYGELEIGVIALKLQIDSSWNTAVTRLNEFINFELNVLEERLMKLTKLANRKRKSSEKNHFLQCAILSLWVHPDIPLWLMQVEPAMQVVGILGERWGVGVAASVRRKTYEKARQRLIENDELVANHTAVIRSVKFKSSSAVPTIESFGFTAKFTHCIPELDPRPFYGGIRTRNLPEY